MNESPVSGLDPDLRRVLRTQPRTNSVLFPGCVRVLARSSRVRLLTISALVALFTGTLEAGSRTRFIRGAEVKIDREKEKRAAREKLIDEDLARHIRDEREFRESMLKLMNDNSAALYSLRRQIGEYQRENIKHLKSIQSSLSSSSARSSVGSQSRTAAVTRTPSNLQGDTFIEIADEVETLNQKAMKGGGGLSADDRQALQERHFALASRVKSLTAEFRRAIKKDPAVEQVDEKIDLLAEAHDDLEKLQIVLWPETD